MRPRPFHPALALFLAISTFSLPGHGQDSPDTGVIDRADSLQAAGQIASASALIEEVIPGARAAADTCLLGNLLHRRGFYALAMRDPQGASVALEEAVTFAGTCPDSAQWAASLRWLARVYGMTGRLEDSVAPCRKLVEVGTAIGDRVNTGWGHVGLAWADWMAGRADAALEQYEAAVEQFEGIHPEGEAWALNGIAIVLLYQGRIDESLPIFARNLGLARAAGDLSGQAMALNNLGNAHFELGRPDEAQEMFAEAVAIQRAARWSNDDFSPLFNVAFCQLELGRTAEAESTLAEAYSLGVELDRPRLRTLARLEQGQVYAWTQRPHAAVAVLESALADDVSLADEDRAEVALHLARAKMEMGQLEPALATLEAAAAGAGSNVHVLDQSKLAALRGWVLLDLQRPAEAAPSFRGAYETTLGMNNRGEALASGFGVGLAFAGLDEPDSALIWYERTLALWEETREAPEPEEWRVRLGAKGRDVFPALTLLLADRGRLEEGADRIQAYKTRTLLERMLGPGKRLAEHMAAGEAVAVTMARLQGKVLREGEVFLDYYLGQPSSLVIAVTRDTLAIARLPGRDDLAPRLRACYGLLKDPGAGAAATVDAVGRALANDLTAPLAGLLASSRRVLVSPEGALNLFPFGAWNGPPGGPAWTRIPSAGFLAAVRARGTIEEADAIVHAVVGTIGLDGTPLPGPEREIESLKQGIARVEVVHPVVEEEVPGSFLQGAGILHVAAHARTVDKSPWNSAIYLDAGNDLVPLRAGAIADLDLEARLAVLSSCNTAGGRIVSGEGVMGLTSAFFRAGVPAVVASLWAVDDAVTTALMLAFYEEMAAGHDVAHALAAAQRKIRENPATSHPAYWAGFVAAGDAGRTMAVGTRAGWPASRVALVVTGFLILVLIWRTRPRSKA